MYPEYFVQNLLLSLIFAVAKETVCVDSVRIAIEFDVHVVRPVEIILNGKSNLCGCSTKIHGPYGLFPFGAHVGVPQVFLPMNRRVTLKYVKQQLFLFIMFSVYNTSRKFPIR